MTDLIERDSSLAIKYSSHNEINGDGISYFHRSIMFNKGSKNPRNNNDFKKEWKTPFYLNCWRGTMGHKIFSYIIS